MLLKPGDKVLIESTGQTGTLLGKYKLISGEVHCGIRVDAYQLDRVTYQMPSNLSKIPHPLDKVEVVSDTSRFRGVKVKYSSTQAVEHECGCSHLTVRKSLVTVPTLLN